VKLVALSSIVLLLATGSTLVQEVLYDFDWEAHFKKLKTYGWIEIGDVQKLGGVEDKGDQEHAERATRQKASEEDQLRQR